MYVQVQINSKIRVSRLLKSKTALIVNPIQPIQELNEV